MSEPPKSDTEAPFLPRWVVYVAVPGLLGPVLILAFIFVSELAHDEGRCPYERASVQVINAAVSVQEDRRRCMPGVEEHRYTMLRGGQVRVLGRRRFPPQAFAAGAYRWTASLNAKGQVLVVVHNAGHEEGRLREGGPGER